MNEITYKGSCIDVLRALSIGMSRLDYAKKSGLSVRTIEVRICDAKKKYVAKTINELIYKCAKLGVI